MTADEFRRTLAALGLTPAEFVRTLGRLGDPRSEAARQRQIGAVSRGERAVPGEMAALLGLMARCPEAWRL
jgi:hypothetical protein